MRREVDHDPEPVVVTIGEPGWQRRARVADVVLGTAESLVGARTACAELFGSCPGLSVVALCVPGRLVVIGTREEVPGAAEEAAVAVYCGPASR